MTLKSADTLTAYVQVPVAEKMWTTLVPKFGKDAGTITVIVRALYCLKSAGSVFTSHRASCMELMRCVPCRPGPDFWMRPEIYPEENVYAYILCYVNDILSSITMQTAHLSGCTALFH